MRKLLLLLTLLMASVSLVYSQQHIVSGYVTGQDGNPIPAATVRSNIGNVATLTDENGQFKISVTSTAILTISSIGYDSVVVQVNGRSTINVVLTANAKALNNVVVTALGIVRQEKALGYSTTQVKARDLVQARPVNVANGLTGKVSGLLVSTVNNGIFAPTRITLRGNRSLTGNNQALIIVDGAIYYNIASPEPLNNPLTVTVGVNDGLRNAYNSNNGVQYDLLPDSLYSFPATSGTIAAGKHLDTLQVYFYPLKIDTTKNYMLPVHIQDAQGQTISGNFGAIYFHTNAR